MELFYGTWHWAISGFLIGLVMIALILFGKNFGMSSNLRSLCSMSGAGRFVPFFDWDWKSQRWNLVVVAGSMLGGYIAIHHLSNDQVIDLNPKTIEQLQALQVDAPEGKFLPDALFQSNEPATILLLVFGGLLIGFGSRYAGGCTSGHAISGLSNLQMPSLKAVIGFFIGGLIMVHFILPYLLKS